MRFHSKVFGVSESKPKLLAPQLEPEAKEFQEELFPTLERGLRGAGLSPESDEATRRDILRRTGEEFVSTRRGLESDINRAIPRADVGVRSFLRKSLKRQFARQKESIGREFEFRGFEDKERAQNLAFGAVGTERKVATDILSATNESILRRSLSPTFESELAGGLGGAAGIAAAGGFKNPGGANTFSQSNASNFSSAQDYAGTQGGAVGFAQRFGTSSSYKTGLARQY